jgi:hypothetical protein
MFRTAFEFDARSPSHGAVWQQAHVDTLHCIRSTALGASSLLEGAPRSRGFSAYLIRVLSLAFAAMCLIL